jgi:hypothetical protein
MPTVAGDRCRQQKEAPNDRTHKRTDYPPCLRLWERAEKPEGRDEEFYHQAEKELNEGITGEEKSETFLE